MARGVLLFILIPLALLLVLGLVMQGSISPVVLRSKGSYVLLRNHAMFVGVGLVVMIVATFADYRRLRKFAAPLCVSSLVMLAVCLIPKIGVELNGARRWLNVGVQFQPSEFAKLALVITVAAWSAHYEAYQKTFVTGFLHPVLIIAAAAGLIAAEVDMGNAALLTLASLSVLFVGGTRVRYLALSAVGAVALGAAVIAWVPKAKERLDRIIAFTDGKGHKGDDWQQHLSLRAMGSGGDFGVGMGASQVKRSLTYAESDFIFPIIGEELGLVGTVSVVLAYGALCLGGVLVALRAADRFGRLLAFGLIVLIGSQAMLHIGVCVRALPNKGTALPFISSGGTNIVILLLCVGLLCSIYRQAVLQGRR